MKKQRILTLGLSIIIALLSPISSFAQITMTVKNPDPYSGNLSWFKFTEPAGGYVSETILLRNTGEQTETIKLYPADAITNEAGSFILRQSSENQQFIGRWTSLSETEITLEPNQAKEVSFLMQIPADATPGEYYGGIVKEEKQDYPPCEEPKAVTCSGNIQVKTRTGNRIYLTIPGQVIEKIRLINVTTRYENENIYFKFKFENKGNVAYEPNVTIDLYDFWGRKIDSISQQLGKSLPSSTIEPQIKWNPKNNFGPIHSKIRIFYVNQSGSNDFLHASANSDNLTIDLFHLPWPTIQLMLLIFVLWGVYFSFHRIRQTLLLKDSINYLVLQNDNIEEIAAKFNINWQILAKINKIKAPFTLKTNSIIKIPNNKK